MVVLLIFAAQKLSFISDVSYSAFEHAAILFDILPAYSRHPIKSPAEIHIHQSEQEANTINLFGFLIIRRHNVSNVTTTNPGGVKWGDKSK